MTIIQADAKILKDLEKRKIDATFAGLKKGTTLFGAMGSLKQKTE
jgi:hypothetical protein